MQEGGERRVNRAVSRDLDGPFPERSKPVVVSRVHGSHRVAFPTAHRAAMREKGGAIIVHMLAHNNVRRVSVQRGTSNTKQPGTERGR